MSQYIYGVQYRARRQHAPASFDINLICASAISQICRPILRDLASGGNKKGQCNDLLWIEPWVADHDVTIERDGQDGENGDGQKSVAHQRE